MQGFLGKEAKAAAENPQQAFNWDKAAEIIKDRLKEHPNLRAEAGLEGDWNYTGGVIFEDGVPVTDDYTYLASNWAIPTLILTYDGGDEEAIPCYIEKNGRFSEDTKWDEESLSILGIPLPHLPKD